MALTEHTKRQIHAHTKRYYPNECCGLNDCDGQTLIIAGV